MSIKKIAIVSLIVVCSSLVFLCGCKLLGLTLKGFVGEDPVPEVQEPAAVQEEIPEPEPIVEPEPVIEIPPLVILFICHGCGEARETTHSIAVDGVHLTDVCDECLETLKGWIV